MSATLAPAFLAPTAAPDPAPSIIETPHVDENETVAAASGTLLLFEFFVVDLAVPRALANVSPASTAFSVLSQLNYVVVVLSPVPRRVSRFQCHF